MSVDILGTSCDQCRSMAQYSFTSTETRRLVRTHSPGRPPRLSHSSWTMTKTYKLLPSKKEAPLHIASVHSRKSPNFPSAVAPATQNPCIVKSFLTFTSGSDQSGSWSSLDSRTMKGFPGISNTADFVGQQSRRAERRGCSGGQVCLQSLHIKGAAEAEITERGATAGLGSTKAKSSAPSSSSSSSSLPLSSVMAQSIVAAVYHSGQFHDGSPRLAFGVPLHSPFHRNSPFHRIHFTLTVSVEWLITKSCDMTCRLCQ